MNNVTVLVLNLVFVFFGSMKVAELLTRLSFAIFDKAKKAKRIHDLNKWAKVNNGNIVDADIISETADRWIESEADAWEWVAKHAGKFTQEDLDHFNAKVNK